MKRIKREKKTMNDKDLSGEIKSTDTAALSNEYKKFRETNVTIPGEYSTMCAKEWVDDGSKL